MLFWGGGGLVAPAALDVRGLAGWLMVYSTWKGGEGGRERKWMWWEPNGACTGIQSSVFTILSASGDPNKTSPSPPLFLRDGFIRTPATRSPGHRELGISFAAGGPPGSFEGMDSRLLGGGDVCREERGGVGTGCGWRRKGEGRGKWHLGILLFDMGEFFLTPGKGGGGESYGKDLAVELFEFGGKK